MLVVPAVGKRLELPTNKVTDWMVCKQEISPGKPEWVLTTESGQGKAGKIRPVNQVIMSSRAEDIPVEGPPDERTCAASCMCPMKQCPKSKQPPSHTGPRTSTALAPIKDKDDDQEYKGPEDVPAPPPEVPIPSDEESIDGVAGKESAL